MLQPKNLLTKRGPLLGKEPRMDRKVFDTIGFSNFAFGIPVVFSGCYPTTVSESETVFLCPLSSVLLPGNSFSRPTPPPPPAVAAAALAAARTFLQQEQG